MSPTIPDIQDAAQAAQIAIQRILDDFSRTTGLTVDQLELIPIRRVGLPSSYAVRINVTLF